MGVRHPASPQPSPQCIIPNHAAVSFLYPQPSLRQLQPLHKHLRPNLRAPTNIKAILLDQPRRINHILPRDLGPAHLVLSIHQREPDTCRVGNHIRRQRNLERLVERGIKDIHAGRVRLGRSLEFFVATCNRHAWVEFVALPIQAERAGNQHRRETADLVWALGCGGQLRGFGDEVVELGVHDEFGVRGLALVCEREFFGPAVEQDFFDGGVGQPDVVVACEVVVLDVERDGLLKIGDEEVVRFVPDGLVVVLLHRGAPLFARAYVDFDVAVGHVFDDLGEESGGAALLLWGCNAGCSLDGQTDGAEVGLVSLEVVVVGVEFDEEAVGKNGHAGDDAEDGIAYSLCDQEAISNVGGIREVKLEAWWVDEGYLSSSDLCLMLAYEVCVLFRLDLTKGMMFVSGHSSMESLPLRWTFSIP
jgi:hypothetical protein